MTRAVAAIPASRPQLSRVALVFAAVLACLLWSHWSAARDLWTFWRLNEDYSAGQLVPIVALYLLWRERAAFSPDRLTIGWWGLLLLATAEALRLAGVYYGVATAERLALVVAIVGALWLAAGTAALRRVAWVMVFLLLMVPLPARLHELVALPLQNLATLLATVVLELLGYFVVREGHLLRLDEQTTVGVTEACSGLRMLMAFVFVSAVLAFLTRGPAWQRVTLLVAAVPIAVFCNTVRSVLTAVFIHTVRDPRLSDAFHDWAGLAMMPLGLLLALGLLRGLDWLAPPQRKPVDSSRPPRPRAASAKRIHAGLVSPCGDANGHAAPAVHAHGNCTHSRDSAVRSNDSSVSRGGLKAQPQGARQ